MKKEIEINSKIESISIVENLIDEMSIELALVSDIYGNILIGVIEAVTNAIVHGNKLEESKKVKISTQALKDSINIRISDEGKGFNYQNIPDPTKPSNLEKPDGRGVFLMKHLADKVTFEKDGSIVNLKFNI